MRQLANSALLLLGMALIVWAVVAAAGAEISWLAYKFSPEGRDRSEVVLPGLLGLALVSYAGFNLVVGRQPNGRSKWASHASSPEA